MLDFKYYSKELLKSYDCGSQDLEKIKDEELKLLSILYQKIGLESLKGHTHLDVGTCTGRYLKWAYDKGCRNIIGLDKSADSIYFCKKNILFKTTLLHGCCTNKTSYDGIGPIDSCTVMFGTINHLNKIELGQFISILEEKMSLGCILVISFWRKPPEGLGIYNNLDAKYLCEQSNYLNFKQINLSGFNLLHIEHTNYLTLNLFQKA